MPDSGEPHLRLDLDALEHNIATMAAWCAAHQVGLSPHIKTTMCEPIVARQVAAGADGVTVATVDQALVARGWGQRKILIANEVVDRPGLQRLRACLEDDTTTQIRCLVDSTAGLAAAHDVFATSTRHLPLLLDVGTPGGRTGVRDLRAGRSLAEAVVRTRGVALVGVAGYEGVVPNRRDGPTLAAVDAHCARVRDVFHGLADLFETGEPVFSMGGSAFPDRVVEHLPERAAVPGTDILLRSGCYVTHDHGTYAGVTSIPDLRPALAVRAVVLSVPEPGLAVVGAGKRELPHDAGLPVPLAAWDADGNPKPPALGDVHTLYDHHAVLVGATGLAVTDVVDLGISHPCSAFSRWHRVVVTRGGAAVGRWATTFHPPETADA